MRSFHWGEAAHNEEHCGVSNAEIYRYFRNLDTTEQNESLLSFRSELQAALGALQTEEALYSDVVLPKSHEMENLEVSEQVIKQEDSAPSMSGIKEESLLETNQTLL
ncbi:uncharacterized protein RB166_017077 [Leptodactylus fuscus]